MCVYSAYVREIGEQMPWITPKPAPFMPGIGPGYPGWPAPLPPAAVDPKILEEILNIGKRLDKIDKALGLKDCKEEDAAKRKFEANIEELIKQANALKKSVQCEDKQQKSANNQQKVNDKVIIAPFVGTPVAIGGGACGAQSVAGILDQQWGSPVIGSAQTSSTAGIALGNGTTSPAKGL